MSEPASGTAGAVLGWKLIGGLAGVLGIAAGLAAAVVMCMTMPKNPREWAVALISTFVFSIGGGAVVVMHFGLQQWTYSLMGLMAIGGLVFACGLPGWAIVRWTFAYFAKREGRGIDEIAIEARNIIKG